MRGTFCHKLASQVLALLPAGGARSCGGWGLLFALMFTGQGGLAQASEAAPAVPSGLTPQLFEQFLEVKPDGLFTYARFRFLVPELAQGKVPAFDVLAEDFAVLCRDYALPLVANSDDPVDRIVISYSDRAVEFGASDPDARQFFEQFSLKDGTCIWENF